VSDGSLRNYFGSTTALTTQAVWTPAAGKKARLLWASISLDTTDLAYITDGGVTKFGVRIQGGTTLIVPLPDGGYLSAALNNVIGVQTVAANGVHVTYMGTEE